jgi:hypothetical protein
MRLLEGHWAGSPPEPFAATEALAFGRFVASQDEQIDMLDDVLAFELAVLETLLDGVDRVVPFSHDPLGVLRPLAEGKLPTDPAGGAFEIEVTGENVIDLSQPNSGVEVLGLVQVSH